MRFLLDVNASGALSALLLELGHDVLAVRAVEATMADDLILAWALREQRIIITTDSDFEQMIWMQGRQHAGVLRLENLPRAERLQLIQDVLNEFASELEAGAIVIATQSKIRVRRPG